MQPCCPKCRAGAANADEADRIRRTGKCFACAVAEFNAELREVDKRRVEDVKRKTIRKLAGQIAVAAVSRYGAPADATAATDIASNCVRLARGIFDFTE